jgi:hypothetical protein
MLAGLLWFKIQCFLLEIKYLIPLGMKKKKNASAKKLPSAEEKNEIAQKCLKEIENALLKYNCVLEPFGTILPTGITLGVNIKTK